MGNYSEAEERIARSILAIMRSAYKGVTCTTDVDVDEWLGRSSHNSGIKDYILSLMRTERKKAFRDGYVDGSEKAAISAKEMVGPIEWSEEDAVIGAERSFLEWERETK